MLQAFDSSVYLYSCFQQKSLISVMCPSVTVGGVEARKTAPENGQDVTAPQTGHILPAIQRLCVNPKNLLQSVRIRTNLSPLTIQGWQWPLRRSGDLRTSWAPRKQRPCSGCFRLTCQTSVHHRGSQACFRPETRAVTMERQRRPQSVVNQNIKEWRGHMENHLPLGQQERGRLMYSD